MSSDIKLTTNSSALNTDTSPQPNTLPRNEDVATFEKLINSLPNTAELTTADYLNSQANNYFSSPEELIKQKTEQRLNKLTEQINNKLNQLQELDKGMLPNLNEQNHEIVTASPTENKQQKFTLNTSQDAKLLDLVNPRDPRYYIAVECQKDIDFYTNNISELNELKQSIPDKAVFVNVTISDYERKLQMAKDRLNDIIATAPQTLPSASQDIPNLTNTITPEANSSAQALPTTSQDIPNLTNTIAPEANSSASSHASLTLPPHFNNDIGAYLKQQIEQDIHKQKEYIASQIEANLNNPLKAMENRKDDLSSIYSSLMHSWNPDLQQDPTPTSPLQVNENTGNINRQQLQDIANKVLDQIFVSLPNTPGSSEVQLILGGNLPQFAGTEILLRRSLDGALSVEINCKNNEQLKMLKNVKDEIKTSLEQSEERYVNVTLAASDSSNTSSTSDYFNNYS